MSLDLVSGRPLERRPLRVSFLFFGVVYGATTSIGLSIGDRGSSGRGAGPSMFLARSSQSCVDGRRDSTAFNKTRTSSKYKSSDVPPKGGLGIQAGDFILGRPLLLRLEQYPPQVLMGVR